MTPLARERFDAGLGAERDGREEDALAAYRDAIVDSPGFVDAHRAYQNLRLAQGFRGSLLQEYRARLAQAPEDAINVYLYGRLRSDIDLERDACARAVEIAPDLYFGWVGLGYTELERGRAPAARQAFETAIELDPRRPEAYRGRLRLLSRTLSKEAAQLAEKVAHFLRDLDASEADARRVLIEAAIADRRHSDAIEEAVDFAVKVKSDDAASLLTQVLDRYGNPADFDYARNVVLATAIRPALSYEWTLLAATIEQRCGHSHEALACIEAADESVRARRDIVWLRRELLLTEGRLDDALADVITDRFGAGFDLGNTRAESELRALRERPLATLRGSAAVEAVDRLLRAGLVDLGAACATAILAEEPKNSRLRELRLEAEGHRRFIAEIARWFERVYRGEKGFDGATLDDFLVAARRMSNECLGRDVVEPVVRREYFPIGVFLDPDPTHGGGLAQYLDRFGEFLVAGQRTWGGVDGYLLREIAKSRPTIDDHEVLRVIGEDLEIPSRIESSGGQIAGFALETFIVLNVDRAREAAMRTSASYEARTTLLPALLDDAIDPANSASERLALNEPSSVVLRTWLRSYRDHLARGGTKDDYAGLVLDAIEAHERTHIHDAHEFLPLLMNVPSKLSILWRNSFSAGNIEAWLEGRAQAGALVGARDPRIALAEALRDLPSRNVAPPHSVGYYEVAANLVRQVDENASEFAEIDRQRVVVQQLDRLSEEELRNLGRRLVRCDLTP